MTAQSIGPVGLESLEQFARISEIRQGTRAYQYSSHDRSGRNQDWRGDLGIVGSERILMDVKGPGCVYRMWFTGHDPTRRIRIYFDGSPSPTIDMTLGDFFSGTRAPFLYPLVGNENVSSGGFYCYVPMPFREGCRITSTSIDGLNYYNITFHRLASADGISTFTGSADVSAAVNVWGRAGSDPDPPEAALAEEISVDVPAGHSVVLLDIQSPGLVHSIELTIPGLNESILSSLRLRMFWDGVSSPAIDAPLGPLFGSGLGPAPVTALAVGMVGNRLYCYLPMPFRSAAHIELYNGGLTDIHNVDCKLLYAALERTPAGVGQLHAQYHRVSHPTPNRDHVFLETEGAGHLVGVVQTLRGYSDSEWYLEGDERIYVDGSRTPALYGTGTEDFYNGGWYFKQGPFTLPLHGNPTSDDEGTHAHSCYRFFMGDVIPFTSYIRAGIEHGGWNAHDVDMETVAFYYLAPRGLSRLTDELDPGSSVSEAAHDYHVSGPGYIDNRYLSYEGDDDNLYKADTGWSLQPGAASEFTVRVHPSNNAGILLQRRFDYGFPDQEARVYVDGVLAGSWYDAGSNGFWADSEFMVSPSITQQKEYVHIRVVNASMVSDWNEYLYQIYTLLPTRAVARGDFDYDGDVDQSDFGHLQGCLTGPFVEQTHPVCEDTRLDADEDVDSADVRLFQDCLSGDKVIAEEECYP